MRDDSPLDNAEIVVVGTGAGGAVVAKELAEKGHDVIMLEEGGHFSGEDFKRKHSELVPMLFRNSLAVPVFSRPVIPLLMGRAVGGTTVVNQAVCFRVPDSDLQRWREAFGLTGLTEKSLRPYFEEVESTIGVHQVEESCMSRNDIILKRGALKLGLHPVAYRRNDRNCRGEGGQCVLGCPNNAKQAMNVTYVPLALKAGARLYPYKSVDRVIIQNGTVVGVTGHEVDTETFQPKSQFHVKAKKVVLSAGAVYTPYILQKSGVNNPHIGRHLHIHPSCRVAGVLDEMIEGWKGIECGYYIEDFFKEGIMLSGIFIPPALGAAMLPYFGPAHDELMANYKRLAMVGAQISDVSEGKIMALPWLKEPFIVYRLVSEDINKLYRAIEIMCEILFAAGAKMLFIPVATHKEIHDTASLHKVMKKNMSSSVLELAASHPMGTARMGRDDKTSVINEYGKVHNVKNLYVADASIFPSSISVNPQLSIMAFAARTADYIHNQESTA